MTSAGSVLSLPRGTTRCIGPAGVRELSTSHVLHDGNYRVLEESMFRLVPPWGCCALHPAAELKLLVGKSVSVASVEKSCLTGNRR